MATEAEIQQIKDDVLEIQTWRNSLESKKRSVPQLLDTVEPDHIMVSEGGVLKKVVGTPLIGIKTGNKYQIKHLDGTVIVDVDII